MPLRKGEKTFPAIMVVNDLNTFSKEDDPDRNFNPDEVIQFFSGIPDHLNQILRLYFE